MPDKKLSNKLDRFANLVNQGGTNSKSTDVPSRYLKLAEAVGGDVVVRQAGTYCLVKTTYPFKYAHGNFSFREVGEQALPLSAFTPLDDEAMLDVKHMLFIDTETTGLGGTGAVAFLVGCGSITEKGFEVRQYLLPDYTDEAAMLEDLLEELTGEKTLVSYNGAAFDLPLLRDRMILNRVARNIDSKYHLDLLHPARRLFRRRLQDCTLTNVEEKIFEFSRTDDIPGYLIPSVYFEWLSEDNLDLMMLVMEHNRLDIVSLLCLVYRVADIYRSEGGVLEDVDDLHSLSRVFGRRRDTAKVSRVFSRIGDLNNERLADDILFYHAMNFKRAGDHERAVEMWQAVSQSRSKEAYWANLELAKYYEHRRKDVRRAFHHAKLAAKVCPYGRPHQERLSSRLNRLEIKLKS